jgi:hypothetical protein
MSAQFVYAADPCGSGLAREEALIDNTTPTGRKKPRASLEGGAF